MSTENKKWQKKSPLNRKFCAWMKNTLLITFNKKHDNCLQMKRSILKALKISTRNQMRAIDANEQKSQQSFSKTKEIKMEEEKGEKDEKNLP